MKKFKSVLLVDDDQIHNFLTNRLLRLMNISDTITTLRNGEEGIKFMEAIKDVSDHPGLILLDLNMPVVSGKEVLLSLKDITSNFTTSKVIVISTIISPGDSEWIKDLGLRNMLIKPITQEKLMAFLN